MAIVTNIPGFGGEIILPGDDAYDRNRAVWNGIVDRRPAAILRCASNEDVAAAARFARESQLEIAVKCGGHSVLGLSVPEGGVMIDLSPMAHVRVDPVMRKAWVGGGSLLRNLDVAAQKYGLATTAGNVSHTGVGGLTLGGGMGWLARQLGLACDNLEACTVVTADGRVVRASESENPDLLWGLRGGGGNFGIVTEFEFRLHPIRGRALIADFVFDAADGPHAMRGWRDLLPDAPRAATLTASATTVGGVPIVNVGCVWVGDMAEGQRYLSTFRELGKSTTERVREMSYVELQSISDDPNSHGVRRYSKGHYLTRPSSAMTQSTPSWRAACPRTLSIPTGPGSRTAASRRTAARSPTSATTMPHSATAEHSSSLVAARAGLTRPRMTTASPPLGPMARHSNRSRTGST